jgi:hypothetical protein
VRRLGCLLGSLLLPLIRQIAHGTSGRSAIAWGFRVVLYAGEQQLSYGDRLTALPMAAGSEVASDATCPVHETTWTHNSLDAYPVAATLIA